MWVLLAIVIKTVNPSTTFPVLDKPLIYSSENECKKKMKEIYKEYKILQANYPVEIVFKKNDNNQEYMIYTYKSDYTSPKITTYYQCLQTYSEE